MTSGHCWIASTNRSCHSGTPAASTPLGLPAPAFRMRGFPLLTLLGGGPMLAVMVTTYCTAEFHMTLIFGIPFLVALPVVYAVW